MFELFAMSLREYWTEVNNSDEPVEESIAELQGVLSEHYGKKVEWSEPELDAGKDGDEEVSVDVIDDEQLSSVHAVAAKLELDGNLDNFEFDPEEPWTCEVFDRLAEELEDEASDDDIEKFCHLLSIGNSLECIAVPVDLPFVAQINVTGDDDDAEEHHHHCDDGECDCGCDCEDDGGIDISSLPALRRELDELAAVLKIDKSLTLDDLDSADLNWDDDPYAKAKFGWYILSAKVDEATAAGLPLIIRYTEEFEDDDDEAVEDESLD